MIRRNRETHSAHPCHLVKPFAGCVGAALALLAASLIPLTAALAHGGGTPRLTNAPAGPYSVYAWTEPEPLRQGETHLTIGVTLPATDTVQSGQVEVAITDAEVVVIYSRTDGVDRSVVISARPQETLGTVYYEADAAIPSPGQWQVDISVDGPDGGGEVAFITDVAPQRRLNTTLLAGAAALLFGAAGVLALRARRRDTTDSRASRMRREVRRA
jgi:hypothetical protein